MDDGLGYGVHEFGGDVRSLEDAYRRGLLLREKLSAEFPAIASYRQELASSHHELAGLLQQTGRSEEIETGFQTALMTPLEVRS